jgi:hypothetical protein
MVAFGKPSTNFVLDLLNDVQGAAELALAGEVAYYSKSFALEKNRTYGLHARFTGTAINVKIELEESNYDLTAAEEGAAHAKWAVGTQLSAGVVNSTKVVLACSPVAAKYARLKLTGLTGNHADCKLVLAELASAKNM